MNGMRQGKRAAERIAPMGPGHERVRDGALGGGKVVLVSVLNVYLGDD